MTSVFLPLPLAGEGRGEGKPLSGAARAAEGRGDGPRALLALALIATAAACSRDINLLGPRADGGGADTVSPNDTVTVNPACSGLGDPIALPTAAGSTCAAALATRGHRFALCSCETMNAPARVRTDAYDSRDPLAFDETAAAIGIGGNLTSTAEVRAGGAFYVAGAGGIDASNHIRSSLSLRVGGPVTIHNDNGDIGTDAYINGNVTGNVRVDGTLHVPAGAVLGAGVEAASVVNEAVSVPSPCDCSAGFVNVGAAVSAAATNNANAAIGLSPSALAAVSTTTMIDLPCGTFYVDKIYADAAVTVAVHGRTVLAVAGDVALHAAFSVVLDPSAELDLIVGGRLTTSGGGAFGAAGAAARFRAWIAGTSTISFDDAPAVHAVIHAPFAPVTAASGLPLSGSLLARSVSIGADSDLHYDRAILEAGTICNEPAASVVP